MSRQRKLPIITSQKPKTEVKKKRLKPSIKKIAASTKAGLVFPVEDFESLLRENKYSNRVRSDAPVYMAAVIEYLVTEIMELAGITATEHKCKIIQPRHIMLAVRADEELNELTRGVIFPSAGVPVIPIRSTLLYDNILSLKYDGSSDELDSVVMDEEFYASETDSLIDLSESFNNNDLNEQALAIESTVIDQEFVAAKMDSFTELSESSNNDLNEKDNVVKRAFSDEESYASEMNNLTGLSESSDKNDFNEKHNDIDSTIMDEVMEEPCGLEMVSITDRSECSTSESDEKGSFSDRKILADESCATETNSFADSLEFSDKSYLSEISRVSDVAVVDKGINASETTITPDSIMQQPGSFYLHEALVLINATLFDGDNLVEAKIQLRIHVKSKLECLDFTPVEFVYEGKRIWKNPKMESEESNMKY